MLSSPVSHIPIFIHLDFQLIPEQTHVLANQRHPVHKPRVLHLVKKSLHDHLPNAAPVQPRQHGERVYPYGPARLLVPEILGRPPAPRAPVLGVAHVGVGDDVAAAPGRDDVGEQYAHGAVDAACLDGPGGREGLEAGPFGLFWDDGKEDA